LIQVYIPQVLELIETSPVNSNLQLAALRLLTNLSAADVCHHLLRDSIRLLLSLLVVSSQVLQVGVVFIIYNPTLTPLITLLLYSGHQFMYCMFLLCVQYNVKLHLFSKLVF
jgi:hypothetical protein